MAGTPPRTQGFVFESSEIAAQVEFFSRNNAEAERLYAELEKADPGGGGSFFGAISYQSALGRLRCLAGDENSGRAILNRCLKTETETRSRKEHNIPKHFIA